jgi:hypothetical protein
MRTLALVAGLTLVFGGGAALAQKGAEKAKPAAKAKEGAKGGAVTVELVGLEITKPAPEKNEGGVRMISGNEGVRLKLRLIDPSNSIVSIDQKASKIASFKDDKGTDLMREKGGFGPDPFSAHKFGEEALSEVEIQQPGVPAKGATKLQLKGELVVIRASGETTVEQKNLALKKDGKITVGPVPLTIDSVEDSGFGEMKLSVTLTTNKSMDAIKKIEFADAGGKAIEQQNMGSGSFGFGGQTTYQRTVGLAKKLDKATVRITHYGKQEAVKVPLELEFGVGF